MDDPRFRDPQDRLVDLADEPILREDSRPDFRAWNRPVDPFFREPLWLRADCCGGNTLWAFHERHLDLIERFVAAKLRDKVLRTIAKLRATLS
ncbi:hypothetical protein [Amycolatopsis sp. cmx-11-12]|uniref:hypothetical protein n=1 Tax=Amycolatopsis sp. cmx-11-12 TaxID=2785795 RepID=UPI003917EC52